MSIIKNAEAGIATLLLIVALGVAMPQNAIAWYETDYSNQTMYFSGHRMSGWSPPAGVTGVQPIYNNNASFSNGATEPNAFQSAGNVMPNKAGRFAQPWDASDEGGRGGAIGFDALNLQRVDGADRRNDPERKQKLFNFLQEKNKNGTAWEKMGSAFVTYQMIQRTPIGGPWPGASHTVSDSQWEELRNRLVLNDNITMTYDPAYWVVGVENTNGVEYYQNGSMKIDVIDNILRHGSGDDPDVQAAWVFRDTSKPGPDNIVYVLEVNCANPIGAFSGLSPYTPPPPEPAAEYSLEPSISIDKTVVEPLDSAQITHGVVNEGDDPSDATIWRLTRMVYGPSTSLTPADKAARIQAENDPCGTFPGAGRSACDAVQEDAAAVFAGGETRTFNPSYPENVPIDTPVGTKICFTASVSRPTHEATPVWRHSALHCLVVGKKPKMQVWGGDVRAGGEIKTSKSVLGKTYGSWGEYAALSRQRNEGFASGAGLSKGNDIDSQSTWSKLTFANTGTSPGCPHTFGCYNFSLTSRVVAGQFTTAAATIAVDSQNLNDLSNGSHRREGNLELTATTIDTGKSIIIEATGTVTISGDIRYRDDVSYSNLSDIPQVIIRAPTIHIRSNVTQVDAWLLALTGDASGELNTCSDAGASLTANDCSNQLVINGPVAADKIHLRRTHGSNTGPGLEESERYKPAEVFNLRADAYLWGHYYGSRANQIKTVYTKEVSPRF